MSEIKYTTIAELIASLMDAGYDVDKTIVMVSSDEDGNRITPLDEDFGVGIYDPTAEDWGTGSLGVYLGEPDGNDHGVPDSAQETQAEYDTAKAKPTAMPAIVFYGV